MIQYGTWTRKDFNDVIRRELMDTGTQWVQDAEINQYLQNWLDDLQQEFEFTWAINTITFTASQSSIPTSTLTPQPVRIEAVYYNGFRLAGRLLQNLEVLNPTWRGNAPIPPVGTNTQDTPRMGLMYPDFQTYLVWPTPPVPTGTFSNVFVFEYPALETFASDTSTSGLPIWTQWSAKPYVCAKVFQRPGPISDPKKAMRYWAQYQRAKERVRRQWNNFMPERYRRLKPASQYEWQIYLPPPATDAGTNTATGT